MNRVIRLTESELTSLVRRMVTEQRVSAMVGDVLNSPKIQHYVDRVVSRMDQEELEELKSDLLNVGITSDTSFGEVKNIVDNEIENMEDENSEMTEEDESVKLSLKEKVLGVLGILGIGNLATFNAIFGLAYEQLSKVLGVRELSDGSMELSMITSFILILLASTIFKEKN